MSPAPELTDESTPRQAPYTGPLPLGPASPLPIHGEETIEENPWGYGKRLRFLAAEINKAFPQRDSSLIRVLDVGCGNGSLVTIPLAWRGFDVTGLDLHQPSIRHAQRLAGALPNARFLAAQVSELEVDAFDVAIISEVLEHVADPKSLLLATLKCVRPDGIVLITVPNGYGEFEIDSWIFRVLRLQSVLDFIKRFRRNGVSQRDCGESVETAATDNQECGHVQFFTRGRLKRMFAEAPVKVIKEAAGSFVCGPIVCHVIGRSRRFIDWNVRIADRLPLALVSGWYFVLRRSQE